MRTAGGSPRMDVSKRRVNTTHNSTAIAAATNGDLRWSHGAAAATVEARSRDALGRPTAPSLSRQLLVLQRGVPSAAQRGHDPRGRTDRGVRPWATTATERGAPGREEPPAAAPRQRAMTSQTVRRVAPLAAGAAVLALVAGSAHPAARGRGLLHAPPTSRCCRIGAGMAAADLASGDVRVRHGVPGRRIVVSATLPRGARQRTSSTGSVGQADPAFWPTPWAGARPGAHGVMRGDCRPGNGAARRHRPGRRGSSRDRRYHVPRPLAGEDAVGRSFDLRRSRTSSRPGPDDTPSEARRSPLRSVLAAVGLDAADAEVEPVTRLGGAAGARWVRVDPSLDGAPTTGSRRSSPSTPPAS
jgi:hypothetical protein